MEHNTLTGAEGHEHHITAPIVYFKVYIYLLAFMVLTIIAAKTPLGMFNNAVAMAIAITKATLVILFFMQVKYSTRLTWLWAGLGFVWFTLFSIILQDYMTRQWVPISSW